MTADSSHVYLVIHDIPSDCGTRHVMRLIDIDLNKAKAEADTAWAESQARSTDEPVLDSNYTCPKFNADCDIERATVYRVMIGRKFYDHGEQLFMDVVYERSNPESTEWSQ